MAATTCRHGNVLWDCFLNGRVRAMLRGALKRVCGMWDVGWLTGVRYGVGRYTRSLIVVNEHVLIENEL